MKEATISTLIGLVKDGLLSEEQAAKRLGLDIRQFQQLM